MESHKTRETKKKNGEVSEEQKGNLADGKNGQKRHINLQIQVCLLRGLGAKIPMFGAKKNKQR